MSPKPRLVKSHGVADDALKDFVEVEAGAHHLVDFAQGFELGDLVRELGSAGLQRAQQVDLAQHDRSLDGELFEALTVAVVERCHVGAPHRQHTDDLVLQQHRGGEQGAESGDALQIVATVSRNR